MASITFKGSPVRLSGDLPQVGAKAPDFKLTGGDLGELTLASFAGKKKVLSIVPSLDTGVCQTSTRAFNEKAGGREDTVVVTVSRDLPFAQKRFCTAEGIEGVVPAAEMRDRAFGASYGMEMTDGPLAGLLGRAVVVIDENDMVVYTELVPEIAQEPNYDAAWNALG